MSTVTPVSLSLLEGLWSRPGAAEKVVGEALTRLEAARRISQWTARQWKTRRAHSKERSNKRRKIQKKSKPKKTTTVTSVNSWEHWIFRALCSPSLPVRQVSLRVLLKGSAPRWQLCKALQDLVDIHVLHRDTPSPEFAIQLVGFLSHLISEDFPWNDPVLHETDSMLTSFVASGGLQWTTRAILECTRALVPHIYETKNQSRVLVETSNATMNAIELKLCLMVHLCHRLVLYSAVASPKEKSSKDTLLLSEQGSNNKKRRQRALSESSRNSEKSIITCGMDETKFQELAASRVSTLEHLNEYFWKCKSTTDLSPLACLICAYEMLRETATTKRASTCLSILARIIHPTATVSVISCEEVKNKKKKPETRSSDSVAVAVHEAAAAAIVDQDNDVVMEDAPQDHVEQQQQHHQEHDHDDDSDVEELVLVDRLLDEDEEQDQVDASEDGNDNEIVQEEDIDSEEDGDDDDDEEDEEVEEEVDDEFVIPRAEDDIANVVQQFERRMINMSGSTGGSQSEGDDALTLDRGRLQKGSKVPPVIEKDRNQTLIKSCMQVLAVQHPPSAAGMLHGSTTQRSGQPKRRSTTAVNRVLLSPSAEQSLIKRVCDIVKPPKTPLNLQVFMRRAPTQEEFFRGSITRNPIPISSLAQPGASSTEPTVRDLRQHIADSLQMSDSAELIELLVANQILDLNLKLRVVQQVLWKTYLIDNSTSVSARQPSSSFFGSGLSVIFSTGGGETMITARNISSDTPLSALPPMVVTYRLAGVDGEATEEIVSTLEDPEAPSSSTSPEECERQMEKEYGLTRLVTEGRGISILLRSVESNVFDSLRRIRRDDVSRLSGRSGGSNPSRECFQQSPPCSALLLLRHCTQLASNRKKLLEAQAPTFLLRLLLDVLNSLDEASARVAAGLGQGEENVPVDEAHAITNPTADLLQELIETLASDISPELETSLASSAEVEEDAEEAASTLPLLLSSLRTIYLGPPMRKVIAKLLPFLTYGQTLLSRELAANFVTHVNIDALGEVESSGKPTTRASVLMDTFVQAAISIPPSGVCNSLRSELKSCGFVDQLVSFILKDIPQSPPTWSAALWAKGADFGGMKKDAIEKMWRSYFFRSGLQTAFKMLAGLCNGHEETQSAIANAGARKSAKGDVPFLTACHWMESTSDNSSLAIETKGVGILAETLLDELSSGNEKVAKKVKGLRKETRNRKKEIAQESRSKTLVSMRSFGPMAGDRGPYAAESDSNQSAVGLVGSVARRAASFLTGPTAPRAAKSAKKSDKTKPSWMEEMEAMEDETGLTCAICQEGRTLQPSELLGLYTFVKKVTIPCSKGGGRTHIDGSALLVSLPRSLPPSLVNTNVDHEWFRPARIAADTLRESTDLDAVVASETSSANRRMTTLVTTVSAGNAIHCSCHSKARAADRNHSRAPKSKTCSLFGTISYFTY